MGASAPFWRYSAASYPDLERKVTVDALAGAENSVVNPESDTSSGVHPSSAYRKFLLYIFFIYFGFLYILQWDSSMRLLLFLINEVELLKNKEGLYTVLNI